MKEIIELNKRLVSEAGDCFAGQELLLGRDDCPDELKCLPFKYQTEIEALRQKINKLVPDDFTIFLYLGGDEPSLEFEYEDGSQMAYFSSYHWESSKSIFNQLKDFDWDAERQKALSKTHEADELTDQSLA